MSKSQSEVNQSILKMILFVFGILFGVMVVGFTVAGIIGGQPFL